jgi:putative tricarboxylic transport membrane protein
MARLRCVAVLCLATIAVASGPVRAQWKPEKPVEIIAPSGPAGTTDRTARAIARILQTHKLVDVPVNVVNKPGGSGIIGYTYLNQHPGDGHYVIIGTSGSISNYITGTVPFNHTDFTSVAMLFDEWMSIRSSIPAPATWWSSCAPASFGRSRSRGRSACGVHSRTCRLGASRAFRPTRGVCAASRARKA